MTEQGPVLVLVAHPDDETLGCGGTIARLTRAAAPVTVAALTDGVGARAPEQAGASERWVAAQAAGRALGFAWHGPSWGLAVADNEADRTPILKLAQAAEALLAKHRPRVVITHGASDLNVDHRRVHEAVLVACRAQPGNLVREVYGCEVPSSTEWGLAPFEARLFVNITATLEDKLKAWRCYHAEQRPWPHPRSERAIRALAEWRGASAAMEAAEAFEVVRILR